MSINTGIINGFTINGTGAAIAAPPGILILTAVTSTVTNIIATLRAPGLAAITMPMASATIGLRQQTKSNCTLRIPTWDQFDAILARVEQGVVELTATFSRESNTYSTYSIGAFDVDKITAMAEASNGFFNISASRSITFSDSKSVQFDYWTSYQVAPRGVQIEASTVDFTLAPLDTVTSFNDTDEVLIDEVNFSLTPALARMSMAQNLPEPILNSA